MDDLLIASLLKWGHVMAGIIWMGMLYFFNFINGPLTATIPADAKKVVVPNLMYRCLFWFRWGAMFTFLFGLALFYWSFMKADQIKPEGADAVLGRAMHIMIGMTIAITMWFNVWFIIWPAQQKILPAVAKGDPPPEGLPRRAFLASRYNTYASGPMLMTMIMGQEYGTFSPGIFAMQVLIGLAVIHLFITMGPKVGKPMA